MCHPDSSVARNEAIQGSDIDGGLVVLNELVLLTAELEFVRELRRQGFKVTHPIEVEQARLAMIAAAESGDMGGYMRGFLRHEDQRVDQITFEMEDTLEAQAAAGGPLSQHLAIYLAGHTIDRQA